MSIFSGSFSYTVFSVRDTPAKVSLRDLNECIQPHKIKRIRVDGVSDAMVTGWCAPTINKSSPVPKKYGDWDISDARASIGFLLRMQIEKRVVPSSLLQLLYRQELVELESKRKTAIPRRDRIELKEKLKDDIQRKLLPQISYVDGLWVEDFSRLYILTQANKKIELYRNLFLKTFGKNFGVTLEPWNIESSGIDRQAIGLVQPTLFSVEHSSQFNHSNDADGLV